MSMNNDTTGPLTGPYIPGEIRQLWQERLHGKSLRQESAEEKNSNDSESSEDDFIGPSITQMRDDDEIAAQRRLERFAASDTHEVQSGRDEWMLNPPTKLTGAELMNSVDTTKIKSRGFLGTAKGNVLAKVESELHERETANESLQSGSTTKSESLLESFRRNNPNSAADPSEYEQQLRRTGYISDRFKKG